MWGGGRKKNENATGVGGTPGSSRANPIRKEEKRFSRKVTGSIESGRGDIIVQLNRFFQSMDLVVCFFPKERPVVHETKQRNKDEQSNKVTK